MAISMGFGFFTVAHIEIPVFEVECFTQFHEIKKYRYAFSLNYLHDHEYVHVLQWHYISIEDKSLIVCIYQPLWNP